MAANYEISQLMHKRYTSGIIISMLYVLEKLVTQFLSKGLCASIIILYPCQLLYFHGFIN